MDLRHSIRKQNKKVQRLSFTTQFCFWSWVGLDFHHQSVLTSESALSSAVFFLQLPSSMIESL